MKVQIIGMRRARVACARTVAVCRRHGIRAETFYRFRAKSGGLEVSEAKQLRALGEENTRLKRQLADMMLDNAGLKDLLSMKW